MEYDAPLVCPEVIGREKELAVFHQALQETALLQSWITVLAGEVGIGKSRPTVETKRKALQMGCMTFQ